MDRSTVVSLTAAVVALAMLAIAPIADVRAQAAAPCAFLAGSPIASPAATPADDEDRDAPPTATAAPRERALSDDPGGAALGVLDRFPNVLGSAKRTYVAAGTRPTGTIALAFGVWETTDEFVARAVLDQAEAAFLGEGPLGGLRPASAPPLGDDSRAYAGRAESSQGPYDAALLLVRDQCFVHVWFAAGVAADPLPELVGVAERLWADGSPPDEALPLDRLPDLGDLPPGFVLEDEAVTGPAADQR